MNLTIQIQIAPIVSGISVKNPYNEQNNAAYKTVGGKYDRVGSRWVLPNDDKSWDLIDKLFGATALIVVVEVERKHITTTGHQIVMGGYLIAKWDTRKGCISVAEGVMLVEGSWDAAASAAAQAPCLTAADAKLHIVVRRDFAVRLGLKIIDELGEQIVTNRLSVFPDSELITELRNRGYRVERDLF